jgi:hypothetical protein
MAQQTAVEWLDDELRLPTNIRFSKDEQHSYKELIAQAKEMERQQKEDEYKRGWENGAYTTRLQNETN